MRPLINAESSICFARSLNRLAGIPFSLLVTIAALRALAGTLLVETGGVCELGVCGIGGNDRAGGADEEAGLLTLERERRTEVVED